MERMLRTAGINAHWMQPPTAAAILERDRERLLNDPSLIAELSEEEATFARELLALHSPEQIAAAYLRVQQAGRPTPEEVVDTGTVADAPRHVRSDFESGVWFKLSVGRKQRAEPRWLLPLICRAGGVEKRHVGSIRILEDESQFEITPASVEKFIQAVGPGPVEKSIMITRIDGQTAEAASSVARPHERPARAKTYGKHGAEGRRFPAKAGDAEGAAGVQGRRFFAKKGDAEGAAGAKKRPFFAKTGDADGAAGARKRPFFAKASDAEGIAGARKRPFSTKTGDAEGIAGAQRRNQAGAGYAKPAHDGGAAWQAKERQGLMDAGRTANEGGAPVKARLFRSHSGNSDE